MIKNDYNQIETEFSKRGIIRNGILLLRANDAIDFVGRCSELGYDVLGIDGFYLKGDKIQPSVENSVDFERIHGIQNRYLYSIKFISERLFEDLYFEIVCEKLI